MLIKVFKRPVLADFRKVNKKFAKPLN